MPVPTLISQLSTTASLNSPDGAVDVPSSIDDYQRAHAAFIAQLRDRTATDLPNTPAGNIAATTVQAAINELDNEKAKVGANSDITSMTAVTSISATGGTAVKGTNTNDNAAVGNIGEYISSVVPLVSAVSITHAVNTNVTSVSLTAGDWDVSGIVSFNFAATTSITALAGGITTTSATFDLNATYIHRTAAFVPEGVIGYGIPTIRISLAATTTVYLVALANFTVSTATAYGRIDARRVR